MGISHSKAYAAAGVNIEAGYEGVKLMKKHVQRTMIPGVVSDIGGFGGLFAPDLTGMSEPVLVSGTDGVGTKQRIAQLMNKHDSVGIDCVAMCVNDIICCGAKPIFFLDYIAIGKNEPEKVATLVSGVAEGCVQSGCALIGGETAEHPGTMAADDYDLAGFAVGIVDRAKIIDHDRMRPGDVVIALTSSGIHSNGYSLVRKVFNVEHADLGAYVDELGCTLGEELLRPTKIYVKPVLAAMDVADVHGVSHITGGGFYENIPRCIPDGLCAKIDKSSLRTPPIFSMLQRMGSIPEHDMFNTYNMGVGMTMIVAKDDADKALAALDYAEKMIPSSNVPYDWANGAFQMAEAYYQLGQTEKANKIIDELANKSLEYMVWYLSLTDYQLSIASENFMYNAGLLDAEVRLMEKYKSEELAKHYSEQLDQLYNEYVTRMKGK